MVVPEVGTVVQKADNGTSGLGQSMEQNTTGEELEEVRKLQELVRRLEIQNQTLRNRGGRAPNSNLRMGDNVNARVPSERAADHTLGSKDNVNLCDRDFEPSPQQDGSSTSSSSGNISPLPEASRLEEEVGAREGHLQGREASEEMQCQTAHSPRHETHGETDTEADGCALDEVEVLDLEDYDETEEEDSWLYVSPKKQVLAEKRPESPLKWCRQVLDHPSPETEVACRTLINRLDHCYMSMHSALSSQSSIDSELSTSDDSISMGYKLQDLTDVQIMARLQEESLRQDYASSSASVSRRSSSASLQSLRRGTYSDQEFDSYSLEDEEDGCFSVSHRLQRCSPSPLSSPRCQSPSALAEYSRLSAQRARPPRRSLQGPGPELLKFAKTEEELRHSMPNLAPRTSLRSLEAVRNSRSMEANLQSPGGRISRLPHSSSTGMSSTRLRGSGQSPLSLRAPVKALSPVGSMVGVRQPQRGHAATQEGALGGVRRGQSPGLSNGGSSSASRINTVGVKSAPTRARDSLGGPAAAPRSRLAQPARRSLGLTKSCKPAVDESWKDGCY
ncbi:SLAIN motif-containing protein-like isoform X2 [Scleropages formosus]|uniref:Zgc:66447 n=1 Tax=Scleropages formosus TaxID=113540 RepID=A0A8C9RQ86_SCLFO|nr:SLAIN motif-containing protein-like isoform X2 [Scleropages formosus]